MFRNGVVIDVIKDEVIMEEAGPLNQVNAVLIRSVNYGHRHG